MASFRAVERPARVKLDLYGDTAEALHVALRALRQHRLAGTPIGPPRPGHERGLDLVLEHLDNTLDTPRDGPQAGPAAWSVA